MFSKKRGQITVFIVLGLVMLIIFLFINNAANQVQKIKLEKQADAIISTIEQSQAIQHYITLCIKDTAETGLEYIGNQGGRIWDYQGGSSNASYPSYRINTPNGFLDIAVGLHAPELYPPFSASTFPNTPYYPNQELTNEYMIINKSYRDYYFGDIYLPFLCDYYGPNSYNQSRISSGVSCQPVNSQRRVGNAFIGIRNDAYIGNDSTTIQRQLANFTSRTVSNCVNKVFLQEFSGYNVTFEKPNISVTLGEENVIFASYFPINIKLENSNRVFNKKTIITKNTYFSATIPVRLKRMYDLAYDIIKDDKSNLTFVLKDNYNSKESFKKISRNTNNPEVSVYVSSLENKPDVDRIEIVDSAFPLGGKPYVFQFLRENRPPALQLIRDYIGTQPFDIVRAVGTEISFNPYGYDPDEDYYDYDGICFDDDGDKCMTRNYNYSGWLENESYYFNHTCCLERFTPSTYGNCYKDYPDGCVTHPSPLQPHLWTTGAYSTYPATKRTARYITKREDVGNHTVNVSVCDGHGLCDWQLVRIYIYEFSLANINGTNFYNPELNQLDASDEDPYMLKVISSNVAPPPGQVTSIMYHWYDSVEFPSGISRGDLNINLPWIPYDIRTITSPIPGMNFSNYGQYQTPSQKNIEHKIWLSINSDPQSDSMNITVYRCLPHRNASVASYPFNNFTGDDGGFVSFINSNDAFFADHTCCRESNDYGTVWDASKDCYSFVSYAPFWGFNDSRFTQIYTTSFYSSLIGFYNYDVRWYYINDTTGNLKTFNKDIQPSPTYSSYLMLPPNPTYSFYFYNYNFSDPKSNYLYNNDIYQRSFDTKCDGTRGNICNGTSNEIRRSKEQYPSTNDYSCPDDIKLNQTEKCSGPKRPYFTSFISETSTNLGCDNYGPTESFENYTKKLRGYISNYQDYYDGQCSETYKCVSPTSPTNYNYNITSNTATFTSTPVFLAKGMCNYNGNCTYAYTTPSGTALDGITIPGTYYRFDRYPRDKNNDDRTYWADNTIDCRCFARSVTIGSYQQAKNSFSDFDTYFLNHPYVQETCGNNFGLGTDGKRICNQPPTSTTNPNFQRPNTNMWSPNDNEADFINFSIGNGQSTTWMGNCTSGEIYNCGTSNGVDNCSRIDSLSNKIVDAFFENSGGSYTLKQNYTKDSDGQCGTYETCEDMRSTDPDNNQDVCKLFRWKKTGNYANQPGSFNLNNEALINSAGTISGYPYWFSEHGYNSNDRSFLPIDVRRCCGDDNGEIEDQTKCDITTLNACRNPQNTKGCRTADECVYENTVYPQNTVLNVGGDNAPDYCLAGITTDSPPRAAWVDCHENDDQCVLGEWCIKSGDTSIATQLSSAAKKDANNCAMRLPAGKECNRDAQCQSGNYCGSDYSTGTKYCTPDAKCYMTGISDRRDSGYNCLHSPVASAKNFVETLSKFCAYNTGDAELTHGQTSHITWTTGNCNNNYCKYPPQTLTVWTGFCSTDTSSLNYYSGCEDLVTDTCNYYPSHYACNGNDVEHHYDKCTNGACGEQRDFIENCDPRSSTCSSDGKDRIDYSKSCTQIGGGVTSSASCSAETSTSNYCGDYNWYFSSSTIGCYCGGSFSTTENRFDKGCSFGSCNVRNDDSPWNTCQGYYCTNNCGSGTRPKAATGCGGSCDCEADAPAGDINDIIFRDDGTRIATSSEIRQAITSGTVTAAQIAQAYSDITGNTYSADDINAYAGLPSGTP